MNQMNHCLHCGKETTNLKFCSRSCSAKETNKFHSVESRNQQKVSIKNRMNSKPAKNKKGIFIPWVLRSVKEQMTNKHLFYNFVGGQYTRVYLCTCKYSNQLFYSTTAKQIHPNLSRDKKEYSYSCQFRFGISKYPLWFTNASELITKYGWYSTPGSRNGIKNTNGISRDHLYSITDGWINKIPSETIRHPANCDLIPHKENQRKNRKSKITIEELYQRIILFNSLNSTGEGLEPPT